MSSSAEKVDTPEQIIQELGQAAKEASERLSQASENQINDLLINIARSLCDNTAEIIEANKTDLDNARQRGLSDAMIDRLALSEDRIDAIASGVEAITDLADPVGKELWHSERPNGLKIRRVSVPIGVLGMIYESRPNVTVDAAALCLKSRNAVILRGGSESIHSSLALHSVIQKSLADAGLPSAAVSMVPITDRAAVGAMLSAHEYIDVMIPRGGRGLTERVTNEAKMPVFSHLDGICHIYIHPSVKADIAREVTLNAKMRRTGICGAAETILLDKALNADIAHDVVATLIEAGCAVVGDDLACQLDDRIQPASSEDWVTEYLSPKISIATVDGVDAAIKHINRFGSHHTDSILAEDNVDVQKFLKRVDSGIVMHNTSTQFADGGEFGMGAEIGIATGKMHARGPVGLEQLCTYKYHVYGNGQTRP